MSMTPEEWTQLEADLQSAFDRLKAEAEANPAEGAHPASVAAASMMTVAAQMIDTDDNRKNILEAFGVSVGNLLRQNFCCIICAARDMSYVASGAMKVATNGQVQAEIINAADLDDDDADPDSPQGHKPGRC